MSACVCARNFAYLDCYFHALGFIEQLCWNANIA